MSDSDEKLPGFAIATRQKADALFGPIRERLVAAWTAGFPIKLVAGYGRLSFIGASRQPFSVLIEESCNPDGPFVQTAVLSSAPDSMGIEAVCELVFPCGSYMRVSATNLGATEYLEFAGYGLPHGAAASGGGGGGATGPAGPRGVTGAAGLAGATGLQGATGIQGVTGVSGGAGATGIQGLTGPQGSSGIQGVTGVQGTAGPTTPVFVFTSPDVLTTTDNTLIPWLPGRGTSVTTFTCLVKTAPTGAAITVDFRRGTIATGVLGAVLATVTIAAGAFTGSTVIAAAAIPTTDFLAMEITAVGSTIAGANLTGTAS